MPRKSLDDYLKNLPADRQKKIQRRAAEIKSQAMSLQELRCAKAKSQQELAEKLHVKQGEISKLEHRTDMFLSTLRKYVEAVGGRLDITATFPDLGSVRINQFEELDDADA